MGQKKRTYRSKAYESDLPKEELDKIICYRYSQCGNYSAVAEQFGVSRSYVTRAWAKLSPEEQEAIRSVKEEVDENLNQKIIDAERIAGDTFMRNIIAARNIAGEEILRRLDPYNIRDISNTDFVALTKMLYSFASPNDDKEEIEKQDTYRQRRESIREDIEKSLIS